MRNDAVDHRGGDWPDATSPGPFPTPFQQEQPTTVGGAAYRRIQFMADPRADRAVYELGPRVRARRTPARGVALTEAETPATAGLVASRTGTTALRLHQARSG